MGQSLRSAKPGTDHRLNSSARRPRLNPWLQRLLRNVLLWLLPVAAVWVLLTPIYNRFLTQSAENLVRLTESPGVTRLQVRETHYFVINRTDVPAPKGWLASVRVTDTHFPWILLGALFLAVPKISWRTRWANFGWASLCSIFFHIFALFLWVKFVYATQLGSFSQEHFSAFSQNFWGLAKHLVDLPFKFALPLLLWSAFYLRQLLPHDPPAAGTETAR